MKLMANLFILINYLNFMLVPNIYAYNTDQEREKLQPIARFDWSQVMEVPVKTEDYTPGYQILHFKTTNKPFTANHNAKLYVEKHFITAKTFFADADVLKYASSVVNIPNGFYLEMGVATGRSINFLAALNPTKILYGFDSFEGLPKPWVREDSNMRAGTFAMKNKDFTLPLLNNVIVYKGWFKETLPKFKSQILKHHPIALLHIDSDIYESAKEILHILKENIVKGTIIVFDEFYNYPGCENQ